MTCPLYQVQLYKYINIAVQSEKMETTTTSECSHTSSSPTRTTVTTVSQGISSLPWAIAGTCSALLLGSLLTNLICLKVMFAKKQKLPTHSHSSNPQNSSYDNVQRESAVYENSITYGSPSTERPFDLETNPSYKLTSAHNRIDTAEYGNLTTTYAVGVDNHANCL